FSFWNPSVGRWLHGGRDPNVPNPLEGKVGLPFEAVVTGRCRGSWTTQVAIASGALPPGLRLEGFAIRGVPERAGTWYLQIRFFDTNCLGRPVPDVIQTLKITTEGSSAPRGLQ